jgi:filamentous hemagglutinin family protein
MRPNKSRSSFGSRTRVPRLGSAGRLLPRAIVALLAGSGAARSYAAGPQGMTVGHGQATVSGSGGHTTINVSDRALLNWQSFNIGANESLNFVQPSSSSVVWNRINDPNPSQIYGRLTANGIVVLQNQSGFYFGPTAFVRVGGLLVTTSPGMPPDFAVGGTWQFNGPPPVAPIINYGDLRTEAGGSLFLISEKIENHGVLAAPEGKVGLYAGKEVLISERPDGRGLSAAVQLPSGAVDNTGTIQADAGQIALHARVVNQSGTIEANTVRERNGVIELVASEAVNLAADSRIEARGAEAKAANGGQIVIKS